jgi:integrase
MAIGQTNIVKREKDEGVILGDLIDLLVKETPSLEDLSKEDLKAVAKAIVFDGLKESLRHKVEIEKIDYPTKRRNFLIRCSRRSSDTQIAYTGALDLLDAWAARAGIHVLEMKGSHADAFIDSLVGSPSTVRLRVAAASSFFAYLERETDGRVRNPFRGTKARPVKRTKEPVIPSEEELEIIMDRLAPHNQAAVRIMMETGLRVGALAWLTVRNGRYSSRSKGKDVSGPFSATALAALREAGLDTRSPFSDLAKNCVKNAFKYACDRLRKEGAIEAAYSVHDVRHFFAIQEYLKDHDIYRLKKLLNHASIQVTENYLRGVEAYWG